MSHYFYSQQQRPPGPLRAHALRSGSISYGWVFWNMCIYPSLLKHGLALELTSSEQNVAEGAARDI